MHGAAALAELRLTTHFQLKSDQFSPYLPFSYIGLQCHFSGQGFAISRLLLLLTSDRRCFVALVKIDTRCPRI